MKLGEQPARHLRRRQVHSHPVPRITPQGTVKTADQSVTSSTTLVEDNTLFIPVTASTTYLFTCHLEYTGGTTGSSDLQFRWSIPSGNMRY